MIAAIMGSQGDRLAEIMRGRPVVLMTATETEAAPLRAALSGVEQVEVATKRMYLGELATDHAAVPLVLAVSGCDKVNAAHTLTYLLLVMHPPPKLVLQVGIAGAFQRTSSDLDAGIAASGPAIGDLVLATKEIYSDVGSSGPDGWLSAAELGLSIACVDGLETGGVFPLDRSLVETARKVIATVDWSGTPPVIHAGVCVTSSQITGKQSEADVLAERWGALAESMEGAAVAHVCALHGVPFLEIRGISNLVGDRDRSAWQIERAVSVAGQAALAVTPALAGDAGRTAAGETRP